MNHYYQTINGWFTFKEVYDLCLEKIPDNGTWIEIGSWQGKSISYAVVESILKKKSINFNVIDIWTFNPKDAKDISSDEELYQRFLKNIDPIKEHINIIKEDSSTSARHFLDKSVDVCMIDANHDYDYVIKDIRAWYPKIKPGGILIGDDYSRAFPGVKKAIDEFCEEYNLTYSVIKNCWVLFI